MFKKQFILILFISFGLFGYGQSNAGFFDDFSDGDFNNNPTWLGDTSKFDIDTAILRLNDLAFSQPTYLYTNSLAIHNAIWEFYVRLDFSPSTSNYCKVFLTSNSNNLSQALQGYFVKVGGISGGLDDVSLYRKDGSTEVKIIDGVDGTAGGATVEMKIKVSRDSLGKWELFTDLSASGTSYSSEGTATDLTYGTSAYFGLWCTYTSTRSDKFYFDDFSVTGKSFQDTIKPVLNSLTILDSNHLKLQFSEAIEQSSIQLTDFIVNKGIGNPSAVQYLPNDSSGLELSFSTAFSNGETYLLQSNGINDRAGNTMNLDSSSFFYFVPVPVLFRDIVINELYPDITPSNGLPAFEFIELYNASNKVFDLVNWQIVFNGNSTSLTSYIFRPGDYLILCSSSARAQLQSYGNTLAVTSFPNLINGQGKLELKSANGNFIDGLNYDLTWYHDPSKDDGGWSLEQINPYTSCYGKSNFTASIASIGGTPGSINSVFDTLPDLTLPLVLSASVLPNASVKLFFNEFLDSNSVSTASYLFNTNAVVAIASNVLPNYSEVLLQLSAPLDSGIINTLTISGIRDCAGNLIASGTTIDIAVPARATFREVVINEIMADPSPSQGLPNFEYLEIFNASTKIFDLNGWKIGDQSNQVPLPSYLLLPGEYLILCANSSVTAFSGFGDVMGVASFPGLSNSADQIMLFDENGVIIDRVAYDLTWYQDAAKKDGGFSLEQINPFTTCFGKSNFTASRASIGGSPGAQNAVFDTLPDRVAPEWSSLNIISPDSILLVFSEFMDSIQSLTANYVFSSGAQISSVNTIYPDYSSILLVLNQALDSGRIDTLSISGLYDCAGNALPNGSIKELVVPGIAEYRDIVINEIYADPSPSYGLPDAEFIELYNASNQVFDLSNWTLGDLSTRSTLGQLVFKPGDYLIVCSSGSEFAYSVFGNVQGQASFPSLGNSEDQLILKDAEGKVIDEITYSSLWHTSNTKADGGYSLEQIDPNRICSGPFNFTSSNSNIGGTPGQQNSVFTNEMDTIGPVLISAKIISADSLLLTFNEGLDSNALKSSSFELSTSQAILSAKAVFPYYEKVLLLLGQPLDSGISFRLNCHNVEDCMGNKDSIHQSLNLTLPLASEKNDMVINEVLFNPRTGGVDFVELYNRSAKVLNIDDWKLANESNGAMANLEKIYTNGILIQPGEYLVLTSDMNNIVAEYPMAKKDRILQQLKIPSYNDDEGKVFVLNEKGIVIDAFAYNKDMHFALLKKQDGVSLERLDPNRASEDPGNFHSAAESVGFATPGYENSQHFISSRYSGEVVVEPEIFSPDNDGYQDVLNMNYSFHLPGFLATVKVFDKEGRLVRTVAANTLLGSQGSITWDGINLRGERSDLGIYLIYFEVFRPSGEKEVYKRTAVLGGYLK